MSGNIEEVFDSLMKEREIRKTSKKTDGKTPRKEEKVEKEDLKSEGKKTKK